MKINVFEPADNHRQDGCCKQASAKPAFFDVDPANGYSLDIDANDEGTVIDIDLYNSEGEFVQTLFTYSIKDGLTREALGAIAKQIVKSCTDWSTGDKKVHVCA